MTKKLTSRRTLDAHQQHMWMLHRLRKATWALFWAVVGHGVVFAVVNLLLWRAMR